MHRILILPDIRPAGYPAKPKAGYRISGKGRIPDIRPDTWFDNYSFGKISNKFVETITGIDFCKPQTKKDLVTKLISMQIFCFLPYLKKNYINYWITLTLAGYPAGYPVSGLTGYPTGYPAGQSGIRPDTG
jgi:hypothetical protein